MIGVTGARGIVGRRLVERLEAQGKPVSKFRGDIRDFRTVFEWIRESSCDAVVHLAAIVEVARAEADPLETYRTNVVGVVNLMRALERAGRPCWSFYSSSAHVYAPSPEPIAETHRVEPRGVYGQSKWLGEQAAKSYAQDGAIQLCIGRVFSLYDFEQTGSYLYPSVAARRREHRGPEPLAIRDGDSVRDFSSAAEVADSIAHLLRVKAEGVVNIASGNGKTIVAQLRAWFGESTQFVASPIGGPSSVVADISKLRSLIDGCAPSRDHYSDL